MDRKTTLGPLCLFKCLLALLSLGRLVFTYNFYFFTNRFKTSVCKLTLSLNGGRGASLWANQTVLTITKDNVTNKQTKQQQKIKKNCKITHSLLIFNLQLEETLLTTLQSHLVMIWDHFKQHQIQGNIFSSAGDINMIHLVVPC